MKIVITGAAGFLGRYTVAEALRRGHDVRAIVRPGHGEPTLWGDSARATLVHQDLEHRDGLASAIAGTDVVLHLAAKASGSAATLALTRNLLDAMEEAGVRRLVTVSSFSVYDFSGLEPDALLDESTPLESHPERRDAYARMKLEQERLVREHATARGWNWTILRPGAIYGKDHLWTARLGQALGSGLWLRIGQRAPLPLTYVENCAEAIVRAAELEGAQGVVLNVVDDDPPLQWRYASLVRRQLRPRPQVVVLPRGVVGALAGALDRGNRWFLGGRMKIPGLLVPERFDARFKPLRYDNSAIKAALGWRPRYTLEQALDRCGRTESELLVGESTSIPSPTGST